MDYIVIGLVVLTIVMVSASLYYRTFLSQSDGKREKRVRVKNREQILKEANRRLTINPKDKQALQSLADLYFSENDFEKAARTYKTLFALLTGATTEVDEYTVSLRYGISSAKIGDYDSAYKALLIAKALKDESADANYYLGLIDFQRRNFEKALGYFRAALKLNPEHSLSIRYLGLTHKRLGQIKEAARYLKMTIDRDPSDKEVLYELGECYLAVGHVDNAAKIFTHLRTDPQIGARAALSSAQLKIHSNQKDDALLDLEIGLKHQNLPHDVKLELLYTRANLYAQRQEFDNAIRDFKAIKSIEPSYKDVDEMLQRMQEFSSNRHLQTYLMAPASEFLVLCKAMALRYFKDSETKILDVNVHRNEFADLVAEIETNKWSDVCLFRFIRASSQVGDTVVRDLANKIKEIKAGRGICVCAGEFTVGARQFVEARQIDLIDKDQLLSWLKRI